MNGNIETMRLDLIRNADEKTKRSGERFFKEEVRLYGIKSAVVIQISKDHFKSLPDKSKPTVFSMCEEFWKSGYLEESFLASDWSYNVRKDYKQPDF